MAGLSERRASSMGDRSDVAAIVRDAYVCALYPVVTYETRYLYTQAGAAGVNRFR